MFVFELFMLLLSFNASVIIISTVVVCRVIIRLADQDDATALKAGEPRALRRAYEAVVDPAVLVIFFLYIIILTLFYLAGSVTDLANYRIKQNGTLLMGILIPLLIYYSLLPLFFPLIKRRYNPATLTTLWILPNILYAFVYMFCAIWADTDMRYWVLRLKGSWLWILFGIWLAGFCILLGRNIYSHLRFRKELLRQARIWEDPDIQEKWRGLKEEYHLKKRFILPPLYRSPAIASPLTIGLDLRKSYVILPEKDYTEEELDLILRHELIHLIHRDPWAKFYICLIQALMWFNPLIRISCRSFSEDLERSCDALVLGDATPEARSLYVNLLLKNAADTRGFSTCLSASAISIKNRMGEVLRPVKRKRGLLLIMLLTLGLILSAGRVVVVYGEERNVNEKLESLLEDPASLEFLYYFDNQKELNNYLISNNRIDEENYAYFSYKMTMLYCQKPEALLEAIQGLKVYSVLGNVNHGDSPILVIGNPSSYGTTIEISRNCLEIDSFESYYMEEGEWDRFMSIIEELSEG